jgi:hypothetical protein
MSIFEYYDEGDDSSDGGLFWHACWAQTFTPQSNFTLGDLRLKVWQPSNAPADAQVVLKIYATDGDGHPTGDDIAVSTTWEYAGVTASWGNSYATAKWETFTLTSGVALVAGTKYAIVLYAYDNSYGNEAYWCYNTKGSYLGGNAEYTSYFGGWDPWSAGDLTWITYAYDFMFETHDTAGSYREYTLRGVTDDKGRPIAEAWCRAYNSSDQTNLTLVETRYTNEDGMTTFRFLPAADPVDICVIWGSHVIWYRNVFDSDGSSIDDAVTKAHTQNTDTSLTTDGTTALITTGTLKANLAADASITVDGVDVGAHAHTAAAGQGVRLDHGLALTGLTDDDHTQYLKEAEYTAADVILAGSGPGTVTPITLAASQFLAKKAAGTATNVTATEARTILNVADGADVTSANAPKAHTASHAVSGTDTVFPADPNADKFLMWDDDPGALVWASPAGTGDFKADGSVPLTGDIDFAGTQQCHDLQAPAANGEAIRATAKITEALLESATDLKHAVYTHPNHSGEVTSVADGAQTIANDAVTYAKMQNVSATDKVLGRATAGAGDVEEIACTAAGRALLDDAAASNQRTTLDVISSAESIVYAMVFGG